MARGNKVSEQHARGMAQRRDGGERRRTGRSVRPRVLACAFALGAILTALSGAAARAELPANSCGWATRIGAEQLNIAFPDTAAQYWVAEVPLPPGGSVQLSGRYPHARYMSFIDYTDAGQSIDGLADMQIAPEPGSRNPFVAGAKRTAARRSYTVHIVEGAAPASGRAPNTIYTVSADGTRISPPGTVLLINRVYEPDTGLDLTGGTGLPAITVIDATGGRTTLPDCPNDSLPETGLTQRLAEKGASGGSPIPNTGLGSTSPPRWVKFTNTANGVATGGLDNEDTGASLYPPIAGATNALPPGGFFDNVNVAYVATFYSGGFGPVLAFTAQAPTTPRTVAGQRKMGAGQVRYWSVCTNNGATLVYACAHDDQVALHARHYYRIVISTAANRPSNATASCGVTWLPAGPTPQSVVILRNMLPAPGFSGAIQNARQGTEQQTMGAYYPVGRYYPTVSAFEQTGCKQK